MYFSAKSASWAPLLFQQITRCHSVFSCFSPPCPVHWRLVARERFATREPLFVLRTSGSAPKFPISMTLFRLRLTTDLQTMGGQGPRATTVYESQVILSIKDTPLGLKFCRDPSCWNGSPENHGVLDRTPVIPRPPPDLDEAQALVQAARRDVRFPHVEVNDSHATTLQRVEHPLHQRPPDAAAAVRLGDAQVENLPFVRGAMRDGVARDGAAHDGDEERRSGGQALSEVISRPGVREDGALDRGDRRHVSRLGETDPEGAGRGGPPISLALRPAGRRRARRRRDHPASAPPLSWRRARAASWRSASRSPAVLARHSPLLRQPFRRCPTDPQACEASRPIPDDDALQIRRPQSRLREHVIDELNDRGRVTARSLHKRSGRCASWRSDGDARDLSGGIDRQPATAHPRPSRTRNACQHRPQTHHRISSTSRISGSSP